VLWFMCLTSFALWRGSAPVNRSIRLPTPGHHIVTNLYIKSLDVLGDVNLAVRGLPEPIVASSPTTSKRCRAPPQVRSPRSSIRADRRAAFRPLFLVLRVLANKNDCRASFAIRGIEKAGSALRARAGANGPSPNHLMSIR